jgi:formylmethanofuran dehydrogenase subunit E
MDICSYSFEKFLEKVRDFHGFAAPGVVIGGIMVDLARRQLPDSILFDAISETSTCLPDAVQLLTPCTIGNGWLKIVDTGRYALVLYDKKSGDGVRVFLDPKKIEKWSEIHSWFFNLKSKKEQSYELLVNQISQAADSICGIQKVKVQIDDSAKKKNPHAVCPVCNESYPLADGEKCLGCSGKVPYRVL